MNIESIIFNIAIGMKRYLRLTDSKLDAVHVTIAYHEDYDEVQKNINEWNTYFKNSMN